jgi:hypothetical protein
VLDEGCFTLEKLLQTDLRAATNGARRAALVSAA